MRTEKWNVILCSLVEVCRHSREMVCYALCVKYCVFSRMTILLAGRFCVNLRREKRISSSQREWNRPRVPRNFLLNAWWRIFPYDEATASEAELPHTFSADIENVWSNTSTPPYGLRAWFEKVFIFLCLQSKSMIQNFTKWKKFSELTFSCHDRYKHILQ